MMSRAIEHRAQRLTVQEVQTIVSEFFVNKKPKILNYHLEPFSNEKLGYLGVHELLTVEAIEQNENIKKTLTFFVKSEAPTGNAFDAMIFKEESSFFSNVVPLMMQNMQTEPWSAKCYLSKENLLVLEDLRVQGFRVITNLDENQLKSAVACVARFHACSMLLEAKLKKPLCDIYPDLFKEKVFLKEEIFAWKWLLTGIEVIEAVAVNLNLNPKHVKVAYETMLGKLKPMKEEINVLCHADLWSNNMMFSENGNKCRLVDFQLVSYASYAVDLIQLLHLNANGALRQKLQNELIKLYHLTLTNILVNHGLDKESIISLEKVFRDVEERKICGLVTAVQYFPIALLNKEEAKTYCSDVKKLEGYMYVSRKDFVMDVMKRDHNYKSRIEEAVKELIEFMEDVN